MGRVDFYYCQSKLIICSVILGKFHTGSGFRAVCRNGGGGGGDLGVFKKEGSAASSSVRGSTGKAFSLFLPCTRSASGGKVIGDGVHIYI